jgi:hypothetical protein
MANGEWWENSEGRMGEAAKGEGLRANGGTAKGGSGGWWGEVRGGMGTV